MKIKSHSMDMCSGPLFRQIITYAVPIMLSTLLQMLFNAADIAVIGQFGEELSLAAVGATSALCATLVNTFIGISVGATVVVANAYGAHDHKGVSRASHTSVLTGLIVGLAVLPLSLALITPALKCMGLPPELMPKSTTYMRIFVLGMPFNFLFNFGASVLRGIGDSKRPMWYLIAAGVANVLMNLLFVIVFHLDVVGVAIATAASQVLSAFLVIRALVVTPDFCRIKFRKLGIDFGILGNIFHIGLPSGIQSSLFGISNIVIQSAVFELGSVAIAGNSVASNIEHIACGATYMAFAPTATAFVGQNLGGRQFGRIVKSIWLCAVNGIVMLVPFCTAMIIFGGPLFDLFGATPEQTAFGMTRIRIMVSSFWICAISDVCIASLRGLNYSVIPMAICLFFTCFFRIGWTHYLFPTHHNISFIMSTYPLTWFLSAFFNGIMLFIILKRIRRNRAWADR